MSLNDQDSGKIHRILKVLEEILDFLKIHAPPPRRKIVPGENVIVDDCTFKEVQAAASRVEDVLGKDYVAIILQRIPAAGLASLKTNEWSRFIRLCRHYLNEPKP